MTYLRTSLNFNINSYENYIIYIFWIFAFLLFPLTYFSTLMISHLELKILLLIKLSGVQ